MSPRRKLGLFLHRVGLCSQRSPVRECAASQELAGVGPPALFLGLGSCARCGLDQQPSQPPHALSSFVETVSWVRQTVC